MKKVREIQKWWHRRTRILRAINRIHHRDVAKAKRKGGVRFRAKFYVGAGRIQKGWVAARGTKLPREFCLDANHKETAQFLSNFRIATDDELDQWIRRGRPRKKSQRVARWFDFSTLEKITPSAALVFTAEFDRIRRISGSPMFAVDVERWRPEVAVVLDRLGLFQILELDPQIDIGYQRKVDKNFFILPIRSGDRVLSREAGELLNEELAAVAIEVARSSSPQSIEGDFSDPSEAWVEKASGIYTVLIEAMDNVINHAYPNDIVVARRVIKRWWMTAAIDKKESKLTVAIYDQGVTIPVSLPSWRGYGRVRKILRRTLGIDFDSLDENQDGRAIQLAVRVAASRTGQLHRGKGLGSMQDFIDHCRDGRLRILSRSGEYVYEKGQRPIVISHPIPLAGTLIEWEVRL